ncbi:glycosyltransferase family 9 protein [Geobacter sulfurreducens]|uniref:glycosyltransferase family 9 protein n=1 Tax=Geobacter sulfurreducens TaxID=35554 RepID=UPI003305ABAC
MRAIFLEPRHSFVEMLSLVEHCSLFIGNDSGPGILAQAYHRPALILFGATDPDKVLFASEARPIWVDVGCNGCRQWSRNSLFECNTPWCMDRIEPDLVLMASASLLNELSTPLQI